VEVRRTNLIFQDLTAQASFLRLTMPKLLLRNPTTLVAFTFQDLLALHGA
jgi:hypothetical protein